MSELLKFYVQNVAEIPPNQLRKLNKNLLKTYFRTFKGIFFWDIKNLYEIFYDLFGKSDMDEYIESFINGGFSKFISETEIFHKNLIFIRKANVYYNKIRIGMLENILNIFGFEKIKKGLLLYFKGDMNEPLSILIDLSMRPSQFLEHVHKEKFFQNFGEYFTGDMFTHILKNIDLDEYQEIWNTIPFELLEKHKDAVIKLSETTTISNYLPTKFINKYNIK